MSTLHIVNGIPTTHGHAVHYRDTEGVTHAAMITNIPTHASLEKTYVDLHVFDRVTGEGRPIQGVPYDSEGGDPHTWAHLPY